MLSTNYDGEYPLYLDGCILDEKLKKGLDNNFVIVRGLGNE